MRVIWGFLTLLCAVNALAYSVRSDGGAVAFACDATGSFRLECKSSGACRAETRGNEVAYVYEGGDGQVLLSMLVPTSFISGGEWRVDEQSGAFPFAPPQTGKIFHGNGRAISLVDANGAELRLSFPVGTFFEVQDNRKWNWNIFEYRIFLPAGMKSWTMTTAFTPAKTRKKLLDRFGQTPRDFPGKIGDEAELKADIPLENAFYASLDVPGKARAQGVEFDVWGGLAGTGGTLGLKRTGYFHLARRTVGGRERWFFVDPDGNAFIHLGICAFGLGDDYTDVTGREDAYEWLPPKTGPFAEAWLTAEAYWSTRAVSHYRANLVRKFGACDNLSTTARNVVRMRAAGFTSMGAFSGGGEAAARKAKFPYVRSLPLWPVKKIPTLRGLFDPYDAETLRALDSQVAKIAEDAENPCVIGYYLDNEQAFEEIARAVPALDASWAARRAYDASGKTPDAFAEDFIEKYYVEIVHAIRKYDRNHLLLGNRWMPRAAEGEALCRIAARHLDAISVNYYAHSADPAFAEKVYRACGGKPQIWSEFFYSSGRESNAGPFTYDLPTQHARGEAYARYLKTARELGFVVGTEWFTLVDQSATGRFFQGVDGERYNTGLISVTDRPYRDALVEMARANLEALTGFQGGKKR